MNDLFKSQQRYKNVKIIKERQYKYSWTKKSSYTGILLMIIDTTKLLLLFEFKGDPK